MNACLLIAPGYADRTADDAAEHHAGDSTD
jgi:hypothetical protein